MNKLETVKLNIVQLDRINSFILSLHNAPHSETMVHSLEYDGFMEFVGLYEDTRQVLSEVVRDDDNLIEIQHYSKRLDEYWNNYTLS